LTARMNDDTKIRIEAFQFLEELVGIHGDVLSRNILSRGFVFRGIRVPLVGPQGIFKPRLMELPLSITTAPPKHGSRRTYDDGITEDGIIVYRYRGQNPDHHENVGLRTAMKKNAPLVYFHGIVPGKYFAVWPAFVVGDDPRSLCFTVMPDDRVNNFSDGKWSNAEAGDEARREYRSVLVRQRLHQSAFRDRVISAYLEQCAVCRLKHKELLDAAHIIPDSDPKGDPVVSNGLSLCKLHHAAFDKNVIGIRPDLVVEIRTDVLLETDGPMLQHGLQGFQGKRITVPTRKIWKPNPEFLEERYEIFRKAG